MKIKYRKVSACMIRHCLILATRLTYLLQFKRLNIRDFVTFCTTLIDYIHSYIRIHFIRISRLQFANF